MHNCVNVVVGCMSFCHFLVCRASQHSLLSSPLSYLPLYKCKVIGVAQVMNKSNGQAVFTKDDEEVCVEGYDVHVYVYILMNVDVCIYVYT